MDSIKDILLQLEDKCRMIIKMPASKDKIEKLTEKFPKQIASVKELYEITDGVEINVPGTVFYSMDKIELVNKDKSCNDTIEIGVMNFGDIICIANDGKIIQIDHETDEIFLDWDTMSDYLNDELENAE